MYNALVIGCGNIGALYDFSSNKIFTHAKAYHLNPKFKLTLFDSDVKKAEQIAKKYKVSTLTSLSDKDLIKFDFISICVPTSQHFTLLQRLISLNIKVILCEKPISYSASELSILKKLYVSHQSKIIVNYIRRFHPVYKKIKTFLSKLHLEKPKHIIIKYKRGFINNGSHAFDTLAYLLDTETTLKKSIPYNPVYDLSKEDPTITSNTFYNKIGLNIIGIANTDYSLFELELYFGAGKLLIRNSGDLIEYYSMQKKTTQFKLKKTWNNALDNYMKHVLNFSIKAYENNYEDNFLHSLELNKTLLKFINE